MVFKTEAEYKSHKVDHMLGRIPDRDVDEMIENDEESNKDITAEPILIEKGKEVSKNDLENKQGKIIEAEWNKPKPKDNPPRLVYTYEGVCTCGSDLDTLEIDDVLSDKKKIVVVAWCPSCKKKIRQRQVFKL